MRRAQMRQLALHDLPTDREIGKALCLGPEGQLAEGPLGEGHYQGVNIPIHCPPRHKPIGTWHTHPGGVVEPSPEDWQMTHSRGFRFMCITVPESGETKCYDAKRRR